MFVKLHFVKDYEVRNLLWQEKTASKIKPYLKYKEADVEGLIFTEKQLDNPIWIYWNKEIDCAPEIVQKCYESICRYSSQEIVLLNDQNLSEYIQLPNYIEKKKEVGQILMAGYAELMKFALLEHYGGTWIDPTVYLTDFIPDAIVESDFFAMRNSLLLIDNPVLYPAWFLHAKKGNKTIREIRNVAFAYWQKNKHLIEYLVLNLIITQVIKSEPETEQVIPYINSDYSEYLVKVFGDDFSEDKWEWIKSLTGIHKLTFKLQKEIGKEGTFCQHIVTEK